MMFFHRGFGKIVYDPHRGEMRKRTTAWCVVNVDTEITRYYRWWLKYHQHIHIAPPSWDAHISIVRGERVHFPSFWKKYNGQQLYFEYGHVGSYQTARTGLNDAADNGVYYYVDVKCSMMDTIRKELGLQIGWNYHLTFGRSYEYEARKPKR